VTIDGALYYANPSTEAVSWDKPDCLKTNEELEKDSGDWVWVSAGEKPGGGEGWVPARVLGGNGSDLNDGESVSLQLQSGLRKTAVKNPVEEPLWPLLLSSLSHVSGSSDDLVMLDALNQGLLMHALRERYAADEIYTWVGANKSVLVSVNPFKR